jgi:hypothetical protein
MYLVIKVGCDNENLDNRPQYAVVAVTADRIARLLSLLDKAATFAKDEPNTYSIELWDGAADWRTGIEWMDGDAEPPVDLLDGEPADAMVSNNGWALVADLPAESGAASDARTECNTLQLRINPGDRRDADEIIWRAIPKHTDAYVTTYGIERTAWRSILDKLS